MKRSFYLNIQHIYSSFKRYPLLLYILKLYIKELLKIIIKKRILKLIFNIIKFHISLKFYKVKISPCTKYLFLLLVVHLTKLKKIIDCIYKGNPLFLQLPNTYLYHLMYLKMYLLIYCRFYNSVKLIHCFKS